MKKGLKILIGVITTIILIVLLVVIILKQNRQVLIDSPWGKAYYEYLTENFSSSEMLADVDGKAKITKYNLKFIEIKDLQEPAMIITYKYKGKDYSNIYYIYNNEIKYTNAQDPTTIELLYNKEEKQYDFYSHIKTESGGDFYEDLDTLINNTIKNQNNKSKNYYFDSNNKSLPKFEDTFNIPNIKYDTADLDLNDKDETIQEAITKLASSYKTKKQLISED